MMPIGYQGPDATIWPLLSVLLGGSFLYMGGNYFNDYCDTAFDIRYCPVRPIPAGKISQRTVGLLAILWFTAALLHLHVIRTDDDWGYIPLDQRNHFIDFHHQNVACAAPDGPLSLPALSTGRRFLRPGIRWFCPPYSYWWDEALTYIRDDCWGVFLQTFQCVLPSAIPLGLYVAGISYLARGESRPGKTTRWPLLLLLFAAILLARSYGTYFGHFGWLLGQDPHEYLLLWSLTDSLPVSARLDGMASYSFLA